MPTSKDAQTHAVTQITELILVSYILNQIIHFSDFDQKFCFLSSFSWQKLQENYCFPEGYRFKKIRLLLKQVNWKNLSVLI